MSTLKKFTNYINGKWCDSSTNETFEQRNPAYLSEVTGLFPLSSKEDALKAISASQAAFPLWKNFTPQKRAEYLREVLTLMIRRKNEICKVMTLENGKVMSDSVTEVEATIKEMDFQINEGLRLFGETIPVSMEGVFAYTLKEPLGIVSIISPWNFPFNVPVRKIIPALMAGNTCVFKPASLTPQTGFILTQLFHDAEIMPGVFNMLTGQGSTIGNILITDPRIKAISFTGSTEVGMRIHKMAAANATPTQLEMGGKNATLILEDADIDFSTKAVVKAAFACSGQWCTSTSRVIVISKIAKKVTEEIVRLTKSIKVGSGFDNDSNMGPVCGTDQIESIMKYIELGIKEGAKLLTGGKRITDNDMKNGCFIEPTIFGDVTPEMRIAQEEIFGPVLSIIEVDNFDEALEISNNIKFGLCSSVFTNNLKSAMRFIEQTEVGLTHVNLMTSMKEPQLPFGGIKKSGVGLPEAGKTGIEFFSKNKTVYININQCS